MAESWHLPSSSGAFGEELRTEGDILALVCYTHGSCKFL